MNAEFFDEIQSAQQINKSVPIPTGNLSRLLIADWSYMICNEKGHVLYFLDDLSCLILNNREDEIEEKKSVSKSLELVDMTINLDTYEVRHINHLD